MNELFGNPIIKFVEKKLLVGCFAEMSLNNDQTPKLWQTLMPIQKSIANKVSNELISMRVYQSSNDIYDFEKPFQKWAAVEVSDYKNIPESLHHFELPGGLYAVFHYKGLNTNPQIYNFIYGHWIPQSEYKLDNRPHFEILGSKYKNNHPHSEEDIYIPVCNR